MFKPIQFVQAVQTLFSITLLTVATASCGYSEPFQVTFDDVSSLGSLSKAENVSIVSDTVVSGNGASKLHCDLNQNVAKLELPEESTQGVVSFWLYDPLFDVSTTMDRGFELYCGDGQKTERFWLHSGKGTDNWYYRDSKGVRDHDFYVPRHLGWTRFDIVNPAGVGPQQFLIYIDGNLAGKTPSTYETMTALLIKSYWGTGDILFDEISYSGNPDDFRPNVVRMATLPCDEANTVPMLTGQSPKLALSLNPAGARASEGELSVEVFDGAETLLQDHKTTIRWDSGKTEPLECIVKLGPLPHSGTYWVVVRYNDIGLPGQGDRFYKRYEVQYYEKGFDSRGDSIVLADAWDWLPVGEKAPYRQNIPVPETAPDHPPADWGDAMKIKGLWNRSFNLTYQAGWYQRTIEVPVGWKRSDIYLDIDEPQTIATAYVDGEVCGEVEWPGGSLDLSSRLKAGKTATLSIFVRADINAGYNRVLKEILGDSFKPTECVYNRGLRGEVKLRAVPTGASIQHSSITTSVTDAMLSARVRLNNLQPGASYVFQASVGNGAGEALALPDVSFTASAEDAEISLDAPWANPVFWDIYQPYLYDFNARLIENGNLVDIAEPETFGFREIRFDGRLVKMNGRTLNLFGGYTSQFNAFGTSQGFRDVNINYNFGVGFRHSVILGAGDSSLGDYVRYCSDSGTGGSIRLGWFYTKQLVQQGKENDPRYWEFFQKVVNYQIERYGNSPGIFFWQDLGSLLDMGSMYNPLLQDGRWLRDFDDNPVLARLARTQQHVIGILREADPSRQITGQNTGSFLDAAHITHYPGFMPIQELIEMNDYWVKNGVKPLFYSEQAGPFIHNWSNRPRAGGHTAQRIIPYDAEWIAVTKGDQAFERDAVDEEVLHAYERTSKRKFDSIAKIKDPVEREKALEGYSNSNTTELYNISDEMNKRDQVWFDRQLAQWLNWRADGIGLVTSHYFSFGNRMDELLHRAQQQVTAFIAGSPDDMRDKTHIYAPGETLKRGLVLLNNSANDEKVTYQWKLIFGGKTVAEKKDTLVLPAGETVKVPVECEIPALKDGEGTLEMTLSEAGKKGRELISESTPISILSPRPFNSSARIALIDPEGDTAKILEESGIVFDQVPFNYDLKDYSMVIFGRRAFDYELKATPEGIDLGKLMALGKRVIVMEQSEETLRQRFHYRTNYISPRDVYARDFARGLFDGMSNSTLNYWRGESTLTDGYAVARENLSPERGEGNGGRWFYIWNDGEKHAHPMKWGNHHNVATVVIVKPDTADFTTLADCEFALNYAAVWQLQQDNGYLVFSQLDVSGRKNPGPEVERYTQNLVRYAESLPAPDHRQVVYLGNDAGAQLLTRLSVPFTRDPKGVNPAHTVFVLGDAPVEQLMKWKPGLDPFVQAGGIVFSLPKSLESLQSAWTPTKLSASEREVDHSVVGHNADPLLAGLGNSDFYWKGSIPVVAITGGDGVDLVLDTGLLARVAEGKGEWIFCQFEPAILDYDENYFWLADSVWYAERALRTLLSNLGVAMNPPAFLQSPRSPMSPAASINLTGQWQIGEAYSDLPDLSPINEVDSWNQLSLPGNYRDLGIQWQGVREGLWYRRSFNLNQQPADAAKILIGSIEGIDTVFINGQMVGHTSRETHPDDLSTFNRDYPVPLNLLKVGSNEIAIFVSYDTQALLSPGDGNVHPPIVFSLLSNASASKKGKAEFYLNELKRSDDPYLFNGW
ncbi:hypothetical protein [Coraliomargarita parva]|uniref:hypothetical protein n=1 Tax=Coraliomargarita parva TaxID=3014050 RepID=UPI0022B543CB|nr:hypothetical protein [Coraliomargarita parva]